MKKQLELYDHLKRTGELPPLKGANAGEGMPFVFEGKKIRAGSQYGNLIACGSDMAAALGYANPSEAVSTHCKSFKKFNTRELLELGIADPPPSGLVMIREPDIYRLIVGSKLPAAERFERWVFEDVLPTIRRTGGYSVAATPAPALASPQVDLSHTSRGAIGAMLKTIVTEPLLKALTYLFDRQNTALISVLQRSGILTRPEEARSVFWPMLEVCRREGVTSSAGRRCLVQRMSRSLEKWCLANNRQMAVRLEQDAEGRTRKVFHIDVVDEWLADGGNAMVATHKTLRDRDLG